MSEVNKSIEFTNKIACLTEELIQAARLKEHDILITGCSTSEVLGHSIGSYSSEETGQAIFDGIYQVCRRYHIFLAAQCCEHLNRAVILEQEAALLYRYEPVNAIPQPKAGGSFSTAAYRTFANPVSVEEIQAHAGIDIGNTLIGMHLRKVAIPVRLSINYLGDAHVVTARTRPKFIGGERAHYDETLL